MPPTFTPPIRIPSEIFPELARSIAYAATANAHKIPTTEARAICALRPTELTPVQCRGRRISLRHLERSATRLACVASQIGNTLRRLCRLTTPATAATES